MIGVVLAAGDGKRLKGSYNEDCCKPLIKIKGKRLIEYSLDNLLELGVTRAYVVVGKEGRLIEEVLGKEYGQLKLNYVVQKEQKGLVDAFVQAIRETGFDETVILQLSDEIFIGLRTDYIKISLERELYDFYCGVTVEDNPEKIKNNYSVDTENDGVIKKCIEKPRSIVNNLKGTGFCVFNSKSLQTLKESESTDKIKLYDLCDYINFLNLKNNKGMALKIAEKEFNINTFSDLFEVQNYLDK